MKVLIVTAQFPFPARSGFTRRVHQLARQLATRHEVTLLSYAPPEHREGIAALCEEFPVTVVEREPMPERAKRALQIRSLASPRPFAARAVCTAQMQRAVDEVCEKESPDVIQLESSVLCAFAFPPGIRLILDEHNVESELLGRMGEGERSVLRRGFNRWEHRRYQRFERHHWARADGCLVTSPRDEPVVRDAAPDTPTMVVPNGVDLDYFAPNGRTVSPRTVVFNGVFDYRPNLDAAHWLVEEVWPLVTARCPDAVLTLVGRGSEADFRRLARHGVVITGEVPDVRPHLAGAAAIAVPVRIGGGTRLKVVEGLAMAKPIVTTSLGCEGIAVGAGEHLLIADDPPSFASAILRLFADPGLGARLGEAGRRLAQQEYSWRSAGERMEALYRQVAPEVSAPGVRSLLGDE